MNEFLKDLLTEKELEYLNEIFSFSIEPDTKIHELQEKIAVADFLESRMTKILFKLRFLYSELEVDFDCWKAEEIHNVPLDYDGIPELLKNQKDYEREIRRRNEFNETNKVLNKLQTVILTLEEKQKNLINMQWKVKNIIEIEKLKQGVFV